MAIRDFYPEWLHFGEPGEPKIELRGYDCNLPKSGFIRLDLGDGDVVIVSYTDRIEHEDGRIEFVGCSTVSDDE